jgi:phosphate transport system permease protein
MAAQDDDVPRIIVARSSGSDRIFRGILRGAGIAVLLITLLILVFLIVRSLSAFQRAGFGFFTTAAFFPETSDQFGIAALLPDSALIAAIALVVAVPVGVATAIYISEYAPHVLRRPLDRGDRPDGRDTQHRVRPVGPVLPDAPHPRL